MPNKAYQKGARFERKVQAWLKYIGYELVVRSAGSHGLADLIGVAIDGHVCLIQCSTTKKKKPISAYRALGLFGRCDNVHCYVAYPDHLDIYRSWGTWETVPEKYSIPKERKYE